ncbi:MAG: hypothetical protein PHD67_05115 [Oscillospiraceae bacterium]|nr:hypothetical protein [Oscillospiraceae bacterium]
MKASSQPLRTPPARLTVVCVTNQLQCERLIRSGRAVADISKTGLAVINISKPDLSQGDAAALEYLFEVSKQHGAEMTVLYSADPLKKLIGYIKTAKPVNIVTGLPTGGSQVLPRMWKKFPSASFFTVSLDGVLQAVYTAPSAEGAPETAPSLSP